MTETTVVLPEDIVGAIQLAIEGAANPETALRVIEALSDLYTVDPAATRPTKLLVETLQALGATFQVADPERSVKS